MATESAMKEERRVRHGEVIKSYVEKIFSKISVSSVALFSLLDLDS